MNDNTYAAIRAAQQLQCGVWLAANNKKIHDLYSNATKCGGKLYRDWKNGGANKAIYDFKEYEIEIRLGTYDDDIEVVANVMCNSKSIFMTGVFFKNLEL